MKSPIHLPPFVQKESSWPGWNFPEQYSVIGSRHIRPAKLLNESAIAQSHPHLPLLSLEQGSPLLHFLSGKEHFSTSLSQAVPVKPGGQTQASIKYPDWDLRANCSVVPSMNVQ